MGNALRKMHEVNTELWFEGISLCLWYRLNKKEGKARDGWTKYSQIDPTEDEETEEKPKKGPKIDGKSLFINLNVDAESETILEKSMIAVLKDYGNKATYKVMSRKQIGIYFQELEETKNAETALLEELKDNAQVTRI